MKTLLKATFHHVSKNTFSLGSTVDLVSHRTASRMYAWRCPWCMIVVLTCALTVACSASKPVSTTVPVPPTQPPFRTVDAMSGVPLDTTTGKPITENPSSTVPPLSASFTYHAGSSGGPAVYTFVAVTNAATIKTITWNFGDGSADCSMPTCGTAVAHLFRVGTWSVQLTITDALNRTVTTMQQLIIINKNVAACPNRCRLGALQAVSTSCWNHTDYSSQPNCAWTYPPGTYIVDTPPSTPFLFTSSAGMSGTVNGIVAATSNFTLFTGQIIAGNQKIAATFRPCNDLCTAEFTVPAQHYVGNWNGNVTWSGNSTTYTLTGFVNPGNHKVIITFYNVVFNSTTGGWSN